MKLWKALLIVAGFCTCLNGFSQLIADQSFDNGRVDSFYHVSGSLYTLAPIDILHARVTGVKDSIPEFRIYDWEGFRLRNAHRMVYRYEGDTTWQFFDNGSKSGSVNYYYFSNSTPFVKDTVFIAYWLPWSWVEMQGKIADWQSEGSPFLSDISSRGTSQDGRELWGLTITDSSFPDCIKEDIVITGRQHPLEFIQSHIINGLIDYLLTSNEPEADSVRKYYRFHVYPMINPDGVSDGTGQTLSGSDPNRSWSPGTTPSTMARETDSIKVDVWNRTNGSVSYSIDIHSNPGHQGLYYYWGLKGGGGDTINLADQLIKQINSFDAMDNGGTAVVNDSILGDTYGGTAFTAGNWFHQTMGAISYTMEPSSVPPLPMERLENVGKSIVKGFSGVINKTIAPLKSDGTVKDVSCFGESDGSVVATGVSGVSPYTYSWDNGDISSTINGLGAGEYILSITDSLNCIKTDTFMVNQPDSMHLETSDTIAKAWVSVSGGVPPYQYLWNDSNNQTSDTLKDVAPGSFLVIVTDSKGCQDSATVEIKPVVNALPNSGSIDIVVFPNPADEKLYIKGNQMAEIEVFDLLGRVRIKQNQINTDNYTLSIKNLEEGYYLLKVKTLQGTFYNKIIVK